MTERGRFGRLLARLNGQWHLERLAAVEGKIGKFGRGQREELASQRQRLDELTAAVQSPRERVGLCGKIKVMPAAGCR